MPGAPENQELRVSPRRPPRERRLPKASKRRRAFGTGSKTEAIQGLLRQKGGATLAEIMKATGWQAHSVRGFISGTLGKKMGLAVESVKGEDGSRTYSLKA